MGNSITCTIYCNLRIAATWFVQAIYLQILCLKDDDDDDDNNNNNNNNRCPQCTINETSNSEYLSMYENQIRLHSTIRSSYFTSRDVW
jgi:hypothetical protein